MLEPRRLATRATARRMADLTGTAGRRARRLPDPRRAPHRAGDPHRGRHRGHPHPPAAARPRAARRRAVHLRRGPRAQPDRPTSAWPSLLDAAPAAPGPADPGDVGDGRHRGVRRACSAADGDPAPVIASEGRTCTPSTCAGCPRQRQRRAWSRPSTAAVTAGAARASPATCSCSCPASARSAASRGALRGRWSAPTSTSARWPARCRAAEQDLALAPSPPGRRRVVLAHRHRRDVADRRGRARRRRQRPGPRAPLRHRHRHDPADDGVDQPGLGRPARRAGPGAPSRASPTACGARSSTAPGRAHRAAEITQVDLAGLALELAAWGTRRRCRSPTRRRARRCRQAVELLQRRSARSTPTGRSRRSAGGWSSCRCTRAWPTWSPTRPRRAGVRRRRAASTSATCCAAGPTSCRPTSPLRVGRGRRAASATTAPTAAPCAGSATAPPTSPGGPASPSTSTASTPTGPGWRCWPGSPTGWPARRRPRPVPAAHRGRRVGRARRPAGRRRRSSSPPTSTASARRPASASAPRVDADELVERARRRRRATARLEWDGDELVVRVERRLGALRLGEERRRPDAGRGHRRPRSSQRVRSSQARPRCRGRRPRRSCGPGSRSLRGDARRRRGPTRPTPRCCATLDEWLAPYLARGDRARRPRPRSTSAMLLRAAAAVAARRRARPSSPRRLDAADRPARRRSTTSPSGPTASVRVQDVFGVTRAPDGRRRPGPADAARCSPRPTARSRSRPTCPGSGPARGPPCARTSPAATPSTAGPSIPSHEPTPAASSDR